MEESFIFNYLALTACILSERLPNIPKVISTLTGQPIIDYPKKSVRALKVTLLDTTSNESIEFDSQIDLSDYLGINRNIVSVYIRSGNLYKDRYYFTRST